MRTLPVTFWQTLLDSARRRSEFWSRELARLEECQRNNTRTLIQDEIEAARLNLAENEIAMRHFRQMLHSASPRIMTEAA